MVVNLTRFYSSSRKEINGISDGSFLVALNKLLEAKLEEGRSVGLKEGDLDGSGGIS